MAISEAMRAANRANAQKSTGPRTEEGKRRSRLNAVKHGLASRSLETVVLPGEDPAEFAALEADLIARTAPSGALERQAVREMAAALWRARRAPAAEVAALLANADADELAEEPLAAALGAPGAVDILLRVSRYEGQIGRAFERARQRLMALQQARALTGRRAEAAESQPAAAERRPAASPPPAPAPKPAPAPVQKAQFPAANGFVSSNPAPPPSGRLAKALLSSASAAALACAPPRAA